MRLKNYHQIVNNTSSETTEYVNLSMDVLDRIHELLDEKFDGKPELLAESMGESVATVSQWLFGVNDFTLHTLAKLHVAFGEPVIAITSADEGSGF